MPARRIIDERRARMLAERHWIAGESITQLAESEGVARSTIATTLRRYDIPTRGRGGPNNPTLSPADVRNIIRRLPTTTHRELADEYGVAVRTIKAISRRESWPRVWREMEPGGIRKDT